MYFGFCMKKLVISIGDFLTVLGERFNVRLLIYNPVTWGRFFTSSRHGGRIFAHVVKEMFPQIQTCLDVGSGAGGFVVWLNKYGFQAIGLEYSIVGRFLARVQGAKTLPFDCEQVDLCPQLGSFDLALSIEVVEHIPKPLENIFIKYLSSQSNFIIFSGAQPGQP